jgi:ribonuclease E
MPASAPTETREKRSRDRYGRERGPRAERGEQAERQDRNVARDAQPEATSEEPVSEAPRKSYFAVEPQAVAAAVATEPVSMATVPTPVAEVAVVNAPAAQAPVVAATPAPAVTPAATQGMPKLQPFALPLADLAQVAEGSGLTWVNSDAEKIAAVQAAIAAEPKQIHAPRERPVLVQKDEGPLILVETKRDLSKMRLPFEQKELL